MYKIKPFICDTLRDAFLIHGKAFAKEKKLDNFPKEDVIGWWGLKSSAGEYDPFYYYTNPIPEKVAVDILGKTNGYEHRIHTLIASVDAEDTERVVRLVRYFGLLEGHNRKFEEEWNHKQPLSSPLWLLDSVSNIQKALRVYKAVFYLAYVARSDNELDVVEIVKFLTTEVYAELIKVNVEGVKSGFTNISYDSFIFDLKVRDADFAKWRIWQLIIEHLDEIIAKTPARIQCLPNNLDSDIYWQTYRGTTLLDALYLMMIMDITEYKKPPKLCVEATCHNFFTPNRPKSIYCSVTCQNRTTLKRFRNKKRDSSEEKKNK